MRVNRIFLMLVTVAFLAGCAHTFTHATVEQSVIIGKTTKQDVRALLGEPVRKGKRVGMRIMTDNKESVVQKPAEVWLYSPHRFRVVDLFEPEPLRIIFDDNGVVSYYDYRDDGD